MRKENSTTSVNNLSLDNFDIIDNGDVLVISKKGSNTVFNVSKNGVSVTNKDTHTDINEQGVNVCDKIAIMPNGHIYDFIHWDANKLVLGENAIVINENEFIFNAIVNKENLSVELLDLIEKKRGEQGPPGPPGKPGDNGVDGKDTSRYTWLLYSVLNPSELPDGDDIINRATITLNADRNTNFIGMLYNQRDPQNGRFGDPNMYTWLKYSGDNAYAVSISGSNVFKIPKNQQSDAAVTVVATPEMLTFTANETFENVKGRKWKYFNNTTNEYVNISQNGTIDTESYTIRYDSPFFQGTDMVKIMVVSEPDDKLYPNTRVMDVVYVHKLYEGDDAPNLILTNPVHSLITDNDNKVLSTSYTDAYTDVMYFIGIEQKDIKPSDFEIRARVSSTLFTSSSVTMDGKANVRVKITNLEASADVIDITHKYTKVRVSMSVYKAGDGKARFARISGPSVVWKEGEMFDPSEFKLTSIGHGGVIPKIWQYKTSKTNGFVDIPNSKNSDLMVNTSEYFTQGVDNVDFKVRYEEQYTNSEVYDIHTVNKLHYGYSLDLSNSQDKVPVNDFNEYIFNDVYTDIALYQGKRLVPINVIDSAKQMVFTGASNHLIGDIAIESANADTTYTISSLSGSDTGKIRLNLTNCSSNELITVTHLESNIKRVFSVIMDNTVATSVKIVSEAIFHLDNDDDARPDFITMQSLGSHLKDSETIQWYYQDVNNNWQTVPVWDGNTGKTSTYTVYPDIKESSATNRWLGYNPDSVRFKVKYGSDEHNQDTITIFRIKDGGHSVVMDLVNETISVDSDQFGNIPKNESGDIIQNIYTPIDFYVGGKPIPSVIGDYTATCTNIRGSFSAIPQDNNTVKYTVKDLTADHGTVRFTRTYKGVEYYRILNVFKNKKGDKGDTGDYTTYIYKSSDTRPTQPEGVNLSPNQAANGWYDTPSTEGTWWMSSALVSGVTNRTITAFKTPIKVTTADAYTLDLSNENASVACESDGTVIGTLPTCKATLFVGGKEVSKDVQYNINPSVTDVSIDASGNISVRGLHADTTDINVIATHNALSYKKVMTINKVKAGKDSVVYNLKPSVNNVSISDNSILTPSVVNCKYDVSVGNVIHSIESPSTVIDGLTNGVVLKIWTTSNQTDTTIAVGSNYTIKTTDKVIIFKLFKDGKLLDSESIPVLADGSVHVYEYAVGEKTTIPTSGWSTDIPTIPSGKFLWCRTFKIIDGNKVILGTWRVSGEDATNVYMHVRYAKILNQMLPEDASDADILAAIYMGVRHTTSNTVSNTWSDYNWSKIKGETGSIGPDGPPGAQGPPGPDGRPTYTWIRYSPNADGSGMTNNPTATSRYLGLAYNKSTPTESNTASDYTWSKIKGDTGDTGEQGPPGPDGKPRYTWIKYSPNANGSGMTDLPDANTKYIGLAYNKLEAAESNVPSDYTWSLFKGSDGSSGVSSYMHIRYSMNSNGSNMTTDPSGMVYIGLATSSSSTPPTEASRYAWSKIKGEEGPKGAQGDDGKTYYLHVRYSKDGGKTMTTTAESGTTHIGTAVTLSQTAPTSVGSYTWVQVKGEPGDKGLIPYLKVWNNTDIFRRTDKYQDHVIYRYTESGAEKSKYYTLKDGVYSSQAQNPMSTPSVWTEIESFELVATNTILAENANLGGFIFKNNKLVSQKTHLENGVQVPNIILDGFGGSLEASTGKFKGYIEATSGFISGELKIGNNTGIVKINPSADFPGEYLGPNLPVFYTGKVDPNKGGVRNFEKGDAVNIACRNNKTNYSSFFVIDDLGDIYGRNANFDGYVSANRLDITGRIRQKYQHIVWNTFKPALIDIFQNSYFVEVNPVTDPDNENYPQTIYITEPPIIYSDNTSILESDADGTEVNLIVKNNYTERVSIWSGTLHRPDGSPSDGFKEFPIFHDGGRTPLSVAKDCISVVKLIYTKHAYGGVVDGAGVVQELRSKWIPISVYEIPKLQI
ncbi:MAG: hypothetical protein ACRDD8_15080 [Bacteroidales bacterium]